MKTSRNIRRTNYNKIYRRLQPFHKFSFRYRNKFTPSQKSAITRRWYGARNRDGHIIVKGLRNIIDAVDSGQAIFKKIPDRKIRRLKGQYVHTNKGIFVFGLDIGRDNNRVIIRDIKKGRRKETRVTIYRKEFKEVYYPKRDRRQSIVEHVNDVFLGLRPFTISLAVNKYHGRRIMTWDNWKLYGAELREIEEEIIQRTGDAGTPFIGAYGMFEIEVEDYKPKTKPKRKQR